MRVLLVRPQLHLRIAEAFQRFLHLEPLDLEITAAGIDRKHETRILDLSLEKTPARKFQATLHGFMPDVVGFGGYSNQADTVKELAGMTKSILPASRVIVGGVHATIVADDYYLPGTINVVVRGEGATAMRALMPMLEANEPIQESNSLLPTSSANFGALAATPPPPLPEYDQVPLPRRELTDRTRYFCVWGGDAGARVPTVFPCVATLRTSTGCPHRCNFCVVHHLANGRYIQRKPEDVVAEISNLKEDHIYFVDDEMFINAARAEAMANLLLQKNIRKRYISWARSDTISRHVELFRLWKRAGLDVVYVGMESMEAENLQGYRKGYTPDVNRRAVEILRELDITLHAALMVNPDFVAADFIKVRKTIESVAPAEVSLTVFSPPPGTSLWNENKDRFIRQNPYSFYDCMHTILPTKLPLRTFYRYFAILYLFGTRHNPWRARRIKAPLRDVCRMFVNGARCGYALHTIYKDYDRSLW